MRITDSESKTLLKPVLSPSVSPWAAHPPFTLWTRCACSWGCPWESWSQGPTGTHHATSGWSLCLLHPAAPGWWPWSGRARGMQPASTGTGSVVQLRHRPPLAELLRSSLPVGHRDSNLSIKWTKTGNAEEDTPCRPLSAGERKKGLPPAF